MINETIKSIKEVFNFKPNVERFKKWESFQGFEIETDKQKIYVLVEDQKNCCESWGHISTPDDLNEFLGERLTKIEIVDEVLCNKTLESFDFYDGSAIFVNFQTDKGLFQLTVYNSHNGYYGHRAVVISEQVSEDKIL